MGDSPDGESEGDVTRGGRHGDDMLQASKMEEAPGAKACRHL